MDRLSLTDRWLATLLPDGWPIRTSTLITGPGGSGKPLIGSLLAATWLQQGGSVAFMSLQYPGTEFITAALQRVAGLDTADHADRIAYIELDTSLRGVEEAMSPRLRANLVIPQVWDEGIERACALVPDGGPGVLVLGSALNLLLFSPTYGSAILGRMKRTIREDKRRTYIFSVSSTAKKDMIVQLEEVADNLIVSRSTRRPFRLFMRIERMRGVPFLAAETEVPIASEMLVDVKKIADYSRRRVIPQVSAL